MSVQDLYTPDQMHLLKAKKMTLWRNGDAKLEAADVQAIDQVMDVSLDHPISLVTPSGRNSFHAHQIENAYVPGLYTELLKFESMMNVYEAMGICTTADNTPSASLYTKTFGIRTTQTPTNQGRHFTRLNTNSIGGSDAESENIDIVGMLLRGLHIECSESSPIAQQIAQWGCSFVKTASTDKITAVDLDLGPYKWEDRTFPVFTYNSETIQAHITGWSFDVQNTTMFMAPDSSGFYVNGYYVPYTTITTTLEIVPYGKNALEIIRTPLGSYLTDLDLTVKFAKHATNHFAQWVHDKVYCYPFTIKVRKQSGYHERYFMRMVQLDTGSIVPTSVDVLDDDYFET